MSDTRWHVRLATTEVLVIEEPDELTVLQHSGMVVIRRRDAISNEVIGETYLSQGHWKEVWWG